MSSTDVERDENLQLRDFPTLNHVVGWVRDKTGMRPHPRPSAAPRHGAGRPAAAAPVPPAGRRTRRRQVTVVVAEMTGYPAELLDLDLDLEADLGVDTVKQAEVFAAVRGHYGRRARRHPAAARLPDPQPRRRLGPRQDRHPRLPAAAVDRPPRRARTGCDAAAPAASAPRTTDPGARVTGVVAEMTGYPAELLDPDLDLEADLGVDTVKQAEVFAAVRGQYDVERDDTLQLRDFPTLNHVVGWVRDKTGARRRRRRRRPTAERHGGCRAGDQPRLRSTGASATWPPCDALPRRVPVPSLRPAADRLHARPVSRLDGRPGGGHARRGRRRRRPGQAARQGAARPR